MMYQKGRIPNPSPATQTAFDKAGVGDNLWLQIGEPKPVCSKGFYLTPNENLLQWGEDETEKCYRSNIRLRYVDKGNFEEMSVIVAAELELVNEFLDSDKEELPIFILEIRG